MDSNVLYYAFLNQHNSSIYVYNILTGQRSQIIEPKSPHGKLSKLSSFYFLNQDSIILIPQYGAKYYLCDHDGDVYGRCILSNPDEIIISHWVTNSRPPILHDDKIYVPNVFFPLARKDSLKENLLLSFDMRRSQLGFDLKHPNEAFKFKIGQSTFRHLTWSIREAGEIVYGFNYSPDIYIYDLDNDGSTSVTKAQGGYQRRPDKSPINQSSEAMWLHFQSNLSYSKILDAPGFSGHLRFVLLPNKMDDMVQGTINSELPKNVALVRYNESGGYEYEMHLGRSYNFTNSFLQGNDLYMQRKTANEDELCFDILTLL